MGSADELRAWMIEYGTMHYEVAKRVSLFDAALAEAREEGPLWPDSSSGEPQQPVATEPESLREALAALEHERWSGWMHYLFSKCVDHADGSVTIPSASVKHWRRQVATRYADLSEREKNSDREEADKTLALLAKLAVVDAAEHNEEEHS